MDSEGHTRAPYIERADSDEVITASAAVAPGIAASTQGNEMAATDDRGDGPALEIVAREPDRDALAFDAAAPGRHRAFARLKVDILATAAPPITSNEDAFSRNGAFFNWIALDPHRNLLPTSGGDGRCTRNVI